ncbi:MAG: type II toxin-antitoxin system HicA family toxin [Chloroflexi bacterium]|nr:type II toxin-antitoxin system HicA family toxin [Chloroflexota bacterium]
MTLPVLTSDRIIAALQKAGFGVIRQRRSHVVLRHADGRTTVVPQHRGRTIGKGLLSKVLKDVQMTREQFRSLL